MEENYEEQKDLFSTWCDLWDQACRENKFPKEPDPQPVSGEFDDAVVDYFNNLEREANEEESLLQENTSNDSANPIYPDSVGKDSEIPTQTTWVNEKPIEALAELKRRLYDLECKLNAKDGGGSKWNRKPLEVNDKELWNQIRSLRQKVDKLSNNIGFQDEPSTSLYRTK